MEGVGWGGDETEDIPVYEDVIPIFSALRVSDYCSATAWMKSMQRKEREVLIFLCGWYYYPSPQPFVLVLKSYLASFVSFYGTIT